MKRISVDVSVSFLTLTFYRFPDIAPILREIFGDSVAQLEEFKKRAESLKKRQREEIAQ